MESPVTIDVRVSVMGRHLFQEGEYVSMLGLKRAISFYRTLIMNDV